MGNLNLFEAGFIDAEGLVDVDPFDSENLTGDAIHCSIHLAKRTITDQISLFPGDFLP